MFAKPLSLPMQILQKEVRDATTDARPSIMLTFELVMQAVRRYNNRLRKMEQQLTEGGRRTSSPKAATSLSALGAVRDRTEPRNRDRSKSENRQQQWNRFSREADRSRSRDRTNGRGNVADTQRPARSDADRSSERDSRNDWRDRRGGSRDHRTDWRIDHVIEAELVSETAISAAAIVIARLSVELAALLLTRQL
jgi:hypothetical protein